MSRSAPSRETACFGPLVLVNAGHPLHPDSPPLLTPALPGFPDILLERQAAAALEACVRADRDFHRKLVSYTGNPLLLQIEKMIYQTRSELLYKIMCYRDVVDDARMYHQKILDALKARDMDRCLKAVLEHLDGVTGNVARLNIRKNVSDT